MSIVAASTSPLDTKEVLHEVPDPCSQVRPCPLSVWHSA